MPLYQRRSLASGTACAVAATWHMVTRVLVRSCAAQQRWWPHPDGGEVSRALVTRDLRFARPIEACNPFEMRMRSQRLGDALLLLRHHFCGRHGDGLTRRRSEKPHLATAGHPHLSANFLAHNTTLKTLLQQAYRQPQQRSVYQPVVYLIL